jgi:hypothetical protein
MTRTREQIREARRLLRKEYCELFDKTAAPLYRHDPIGINFDDNPDEYEPEAETILPRLRDCRSREDVVRVVHQEFSRWFGEDTAGAPERYQKLASDVWSLWEERRARTDNRPCLYTLLAGFANCDATICQRPSRFMTTSM